MEYRIDLRDVKFQIFDWLPTADLLQAEHFADWDRENLEMVLGEGLKIAQEVLAPTNEEGDRTGARRLDDGRVETPESFAGAYDTLVQGGWMGSTMNPELGGMGLPDVIGSALNEFVCGANLSLSLVTLLNRGTGQLIESYGTDEMRALYCEKLYRGHWSGTMCLTEPQAGSDVGASTTRAERQENGRYLLSGEKIFITYGEHDLAENIVHAVLARTPDAPPGTKGLSLFVVPKVRVEADGSLGESNDVHCASIEHKMGLHGSPTCSMLFGQNGACEGLLLGEEGQGMRLMFDMMNAARIEVGLQGVAVAGAAYEAARSYAHEREQMRHFDRSRSTASQVAIVEHPDVRRMLLQSSAYVQAMRALLLQTSLYLDRVHASEGEERERYQGLVDLLTPVCKAWCSDWGFRVTEWSLQIYGGYGYIADYPAEQYMRDAKITSIYEGTNGIQALDLVGRKLPGRGGAAVRELLERASQAASALAGDSELGGAAEELETAVGVFSELLGELPGRDDGRLLLLLNAVPLLDMLGMILGSTFLLEQARLARDRLASEHGADVASPRARRDLAEKNADAAHLHNKIQSAICFAYRALPSVSAQATAVRAGETSAMEAVL